jgi:hypothetical protein
VRSVHEGGAAAGGPAAPCRVGGTVGNGAGHGSKGAGALTRGPGPFNNYHFFFKFL